jgi:hypothetical protein
MSKQAIHDLIAGRIAAVQHRIAAACRRAGRTTEAVTLVAVTKTISAEVAALLPGLGLVDLGESRPQELWHKSALLPNKVRWHLVGHLQRNKVERTLPLVEMIHSVDSVRLLEAIDQEAARRARPIDVLLEVNASREASKHGFAPEELGKVWPAVARLQFVRVRGLMTMAAPEEAAEKCRPTFAVLRQLRDRHRTDLASPHDLIHLSMGMSNDFEVAIEEGATLVRLGSVLFEGIDAS